MESTIEIMEMLAEKAVKGNYIQAIEEFFKAYGLLLSSLEDRLKDEENILNTREVDNLVKQKHHIAEHHNMLVRLTQREIYHDNDDFQMEYFRALRESEKIQRKIKRILSESEIKEREYINVLHLRDEEWTSTVTDSKEKVASLEDRISALEGREHNSEAAISSLQTQLSQLSDEVELKADLKVDKISLDEILSELTKELKRRRVK